MQVLTLIRVLFFNLIFLFWASIAFSGVAHQIPSDLLADDYESSDKSVNIVDRNGVIISRNINTFHAAIDPKLVKDKKNLLIKLRLNFPELQIDEKIDGQIDID